MQIHEKLGQGAYGVVHRATDSEGNEFAVKVLMESYGASVQQVFEMGVREHDIWQHLQHPNIVRCLNR